MPQMQDLYQSVHKTSRNSDGVFSCAQAATPYLSLLPKAPIETKLVSFPGATRFLVQFLLRQTNTADSLQAGLYAQSANSPPDREAVELPFLGGFQSKKGQTSGRDA